MQRRILIPLVTLMGLLAVYVAVIVVNDEIEMTLERGLWAVLLVVAIIGIARQNPGGGSRTSEHIPVPSPEAISPDPPGEALLEVTIRCDKTYQRQMYRFVMQWRNRIWSWIFLGAGVALLVAGLLTDDRSRMLSTGIAMIVLAGCFILVNRLMVRSRVKKQADFRELRVSLYPKDFTLQYVGGERARERRVYHSQIEQVLEGKQSFYILIRPRTLCLLLKRDLTPEEQDKIRTYFAELNSKKGTDPPFFGGRG